MSETTESTEVKTEVKTEDGKQEQTFTQADLDRIVRERVQRERAKYADYDDLKAKAGQATTAEERIAKLEKEIQSSQREALRRRVQAAHQISDEDADLFLTGEDEESLTAQASRLAARETAHKQGNNVVPTEGTSTRPAGTEDASFARNLFAGD